MKQTISIFLSIFFLSACSENKNYNERDQKLDSLAKLQAQTAALRNAAPENSPERISLEAQLKSLQEKLNSKRMANSLFRANQARLAESMQANTQLYSLKGKYKILVIPVQFQDVKFDRGDYWTKAPELLFGLGPSSLRTFYRHSSYGVFDVEGTITPVVTVQKNLAEYGEAIPGSNDKAAGQLVVQALKAVMQTQSNPDWWKEYDQWDLGDYDGDGVHYEPDGFIDAVVLITAGKPQSSCQRIFDPNGEKPSSKSYPEGPRKPAAVECFNRLWPHRSAVQLDKKDPDYQEKGPAIEGLQRPSLNGLKVTDEVFALDYNMQSEYSDIATFIHEFGHSLTLPDVYATKAKDNSTGSWEVMSGTANNHAQEMSTYSRLSLGWLSPKIIAPGGNITSAYLGSMNFTDPTLRDDVAHYNGPDYSSEMVDGKEHIYDVLSQVPNSDEMVYRAAIALMPPTPEAKKILDVNSQHGHMVAYSSHYDSNSRSYKRKFKVPNEGPAELTFDIAYSIETGTTFESTEPEIKINQDYDMGYILINGVEKERLQLLSGDNDKDSLAEDNKKCEVARVKELRLKVYGKTASDEEAKEFKSKLEVCRTPVWISKKYDVSEFRGKEIDFEVRYTTDPGYTEMGILLDNVALGDSKEDFESIAKLDDWVLIKDGIQMLDHNQFYIFEYRDPEIQYQKTAQGEAYNFDQNISPGSHGFFVDQGKNSLEKLRVLTAKYQPGVLVWYYNSRFDTVSNNPALQDGKGYLLVLNANPKELVMPATWSQKEWLGEEGYYLDPEKDEPLKSFVSKQRDEFVCISHTDFYKYLEGVEAQCTDKDARDALKNLKLGEKSLVYLREMINQVHPLDYGNYLTIDRPFGRGGHSTNVVTGLSTFRPKGSESFSPFAAYRVDLKDKKLVADADLQKEVVSYAPVFEFSDSKYELPKKKDRWLDTANVEKAGFSFQVVNPSTQIVNRYVNSTDSQANDFVERKPRVKIYFQLSNQR